MSVIVSGSLAYDRILIVEGLLSTLVTRKSYSPLDVGFHASKIVEKFGGNAGNIAYTLSLLGEKPIIISSVGNDYQRYFRWLTDNRIATEEIRIVEQEMTASAYVTADRYHNQIVTFVPGAMEYPSLFDLSKIHVEETLVVISSGNLVDMKHYCHICKSIGISYIFNPGQSLSRWNDDDLIACIGGATAVIVNERELELIEGKSRLGKKALLRLVKALIITLGDRGSEVYAQDHEINIPAIKVKEVIDPRGAGDAYTGGFAKGLLQGKTIVQSAMMATVCASFSLEYPGTQEFNFSQQEFEYRLKKLRSGINGQ